MFVLQYLNGGTDLYFNFTFLVAFAKIKFAQISTVYSSHVRTKNLNFHLFQYIPVFYDSMNQERRSRRQMIILWYVKNYLFVVLSILPSKDHGNGGKVWSINIDITNKTSIPESREAVALLCVYIRALNNSRKMYRHSIHMENRA